ncbi:MAG: hypothetical protein LBV18_05615 [Alistipes sp.]|jgi:hypothetical protein|nr:hypothetical protein [Alistipes sp.]
MTRLAAIIAILGSLLLTPTILSAQTFDAEWWPRSDTDDYDRADHGAYGYPENRPGELDPVTDGLVFSTPAWAAPDPFRDFSRYRFGAVRYRERGLDHRHFKVFLAGVDLSDNLSSYPDWGLVTLARRSGLAAERIPAMVASGGPAGVGRADSYTPGALGDELYVIARAGDRYSRGGGDVRLSASHRKGWSHSVALTGQAGRDAHIAGVGTNEVGGAASLTKKWSGGSTLTVFATGGTSERGARTAATEEAFGLTGDNLYNPTWGFQDGRVRNSRETRTRQFFSAVTFETPLPGDRVFSATAAIRFSRGGRTRLAWYDAQSPMPDYYRLMPSFFPAWSPADDLVDAWRAQDPRVTQVDWESLYLANALSLDGSATYIVEEQVELAGDLHLNLDVTRVLQKGLEISYGVRVRRDRSRFFKVADDMLGGEWVANVDQYITDDDGEPHILPPNENDLRNPGRQVRQGDRFGYDYAFVRWKPSAFGAVRWNRADLGVTVSGSLTHTTLRREGFYEKELFPGAASLGKSERKSFTTYSLSAAAWWRPAARHSVGISGMASSEAPFPGDVFLSPQQNNLAAGAVKASGLYAAEASWAFAGEDVDLRVGGFLNATAGETEIRQYYDDLSSAFSEMVVRGVDRLSYGVEVGVEARPIRWLTVSAGASIGRHRYNSEPTATVYEDATGEIISDGIVCYMSGLHTGLPEMVAGAEVAYSDRRRWRVSLSGEWMGSRYVEINPLYHSSRVAGINPAPEIMALFTSQERLPDAFTLGASVSKGFVVGGGYLRVAASVRNLLSADIIHSGYEQMRIRRLGTGLDRTLVPFPSKYTHSWPATWSVTISYRL